MGHGWGWWLCLALLFWGPLVSSQEAPSLGSIPNPRETHDGWVTDSAGVLGSRAAEIEALLSALHRDLGAEVAVVILPSIGDAVPKAFATSLFNHWKIGRAGHDDGVLVLQVLDQRRVEIETGYGVEGALPDVKCAWLIREVATPYSRDGNIADGQLALVRGIVHALRTPEASHHALVGAARGMTAPRPAAGSSGAPPWPGAHQSGATLRHSVLGFLAGLTLLGCAWASRLRAHHVLYRHSVRPRDTPTLALIIALVLIAFPMLFVSAFGWPAALWFGGSASIVVAGLFARSTWQTYLRIRARYAPRRCSACNGPLALVSDAKDDALLEGGRGAEERIGAVDYDVWKCACGKLSIEEFEVSPKVETCRSCNFRTGRVTRSEVVEPATTSTVGCRKLYLQCANCNALWTEEVAIPHVSSSAGGSSHGAGGRSGGGSSFGGGRSGGGGAGGSY